jgi:hypothetical protein
MLTFDTFRHNSTQGIQVFREPGSVDRKKEQKKRETSYERSPTSALTTSSIVNQHLSRHFEKGILYPYRPQAI